MCVQKQIINGQEVRCRYCWQCNKDRQNDLVGRCIAEQQTSKLTLAVTLTYCGDHPAAAVLTYRDFQLFMKRLRKKFGNVRYIVVGEYGSKRGRAHWHAVLFFQDRCPTVVHDPLLRGDDDVFIARSEEDHEARIQWGPWSNPDEGRGHVYCQTADATGFSYILKYISKDIDQSVNSIHLGMSKKPLLGAAWLDQLAQKYVDDGLCPRDPFYSFADVRDKKGRPRSFMLSGASLDYFMASFLDRFEQRYLALPSDTEFVREYVGKIYWPKDWEGADRTPWPRPERPSFAPPDIVWLSAGLLSGIPVLMVKDEQSDIPLIYSVPGHEGKFPENDDLAPLEFGTVSPKTGLKTWLVLAHHEETINYIKKNYRRARFEDRPPRDRVEDYLPFLRGGKLPRP